MLQHDAEAHIFAEAYLICSLFFSIKRGKLGHLREFVKGGWNSTRWRPFLRVPPLLKIFDPPLGLKKKEKMEEKKEAPLLDLFIFFPFPFSLHWMVVFLLPFMF